MTSSLSPAATAKIISFEMKHDEYNKEYTAYSIEVVNSQSNGLEAHSQLIYRRYTDFENLYAWVAEAFPSALNGVELPSKFTLFKSAETIARERMPALQKVLDSFGGLPGLSSTWQYQDFLGRSNVMSQHVEGLLYCLVESVKGIQASGSISVKVALARSALKSFHGEEIAFRSDNHTVKNGTAFVYDEFEMRIDGGAGPKPLNVLLFHGGSSLGLGTLDISTLPKNVEAKHIVPLIKADGTPTPFQVTLVTHFIPMSTSHIPKSVTTLANFRLDLDKPDHVYLAGDTITGKATMRVTSSQVTVSGIDFVVRGHAEARWHHDTSDYRDSASVFESRTPILSQGHPIYTAAAGTAKYLPPGLYRVPFSVTLPQTMLPTVQLPHGRISYRISLEKVTGALFPDIVHKDVTIRASSFHPPLPLPPIGYRNLFKFENRTGFSVDQLHVHVTLKYPVFYIGYTNILGLGVISNSKKDIAGVKVRLVGCSHYKAKRIPPPGQPPDNSIHEKDEDFVVIDYDSNQQLSLHPDNRVDFNLELTTPSAISPTLAKSMTYLIDVSYNLIIELFAKKPAVIKFPVTVSHPPKEVVSILQNPPSSPVFPATSLPSVAPPSMGIVDPGMMRTVVSIDMNMNLGGMPPTGVGMQDGGMNTNMTRDGPQFNTGALVQPPANKNLDMGMMMTHGMGGMALNANSGMIGVQVQNSHSRHSHGPGGYMYM